MVETEPKGYKENIAANGWREEIVRKCLTCSHSSISQLLSSLSLLGQILSYLCPQSLVTENISFYKLINVRSRSQKSCTLKALGTLIFSAHPSDVVSCATTNYQVFSMNCLELKELFQQGDPGDLSFSSKAFRNFIKSERIAGLHSFFSFLSYRP